MVKKGVLKPDFKPPIPFIPEKEEEKESAQCKKPVAVKLQHDANGVSISSPTLTPILNNTSCYVKKTSLVRE
jgi:hypothetical protein